MNSEGSKETARMSKTMEVQDKVGQRKNRGSRTKGAGGALRWAGKGHGEGAEVPQARVLQLAEEFGEETRNLYSWDQDLWVQRSDGS